MPADYSPTSLAISGIAMDSYVATPNRGRAMNIHIPGSDL